jgi:hypothetical protein
MHGIAEIGVFPVSIWAVFFDPPSSMSFHHLLTLGLIDTVVNFIDPLVLPVKIWFWNSAHRSRTSNEALGIFWGQDLFWWLQNRASKKPCGPWVLSDWKEIGSLNFAGSFLDSIQDLGILFSSIGQLIEL